MSVWKDFCRQVEGKEVRRHFGDLVQQIETSAVFEFTDEQIEAATSHADMDEIPPLPFPRMCLVGPGGVIAIENPTKDTETGDLSFVGLFGNDGMFVRATCTARADGSVVFEDMLALADGHLYRTGEMPAPEPDYKELTRLDKVVRDAERTGDAAVVERAKEFRAVGRESLMKLHEAQVEVHAANVELRDELMAGSVRWFVLAFQEIRWINKADHYTVQVDAALLKRRGKRKKGRISRMHERPRYIVLTRAEIAERWHRVHRGGTHASPMPHLRRGHYRTLRAARYGDSKGKRLWIRATHVNGKCVEWRDGDVTYKVI